MKFIILLIVSLNVFATSELKLLDNKTILRRAEFTKAIIETNDKNLLEELKKIKTGQSVGDVLYIESIGFVQDLPGSKYQIGTEIVLKSIPQSKNINLVINKTNFELSMAEVGFDPSDATLEAQKNLFAKPYTLTWFKYWLKNNAGLLLLLAFILLTIGTVGYKKVYTKRQKKKKHLKELLMWKNAISNASTRADVETLYQNKNKWGHYYKSHEIDDFLNYLNTIQYAPNWSIEETELLTRKLDLAKKSLT